MTRLLSGAATLLVVGFALGLPVRAQDIVKDARASLADLPTWKIPEICAKDSAQAHCLSLESKAWRAVSGSWVSLPDAVKKTCLGNTKGPGDQSWRVLGDCVDEEMEKQGDKRAVATLRTPAEAVPPPKPATPAKIEVPPPVLGFNVAPPPMATEIEAKRLADEAAAKKAAEEAEAKRRAEADAAAKRSAEENEAARKAAEAAQAQKRAEADAKRLAEEAAAKKAAEEAEAKRRAEADAKRVAEEAAAKKAAEDAEKKRVADAAAAAEAAKRAQAEAAAKVCQDKLKSVTDLGAIRFRIASANIDRASNATLDQLAEVVKSCPGNTIRVEGHTDSQGEPEFNLTLSRNRAQAVVEYLTRADVAAELVSAEGFGDTRPVADNATSDGRTQNRRIEFKVQPK